MVGSNKIKDLRRSPLKTVRLHNGAKLVKHAKAMPSF
jgi:hypothetical protein